MYSANRLHLNNTEHQICEEHDADILAVPGSGHARLSFSEVRHSFFNGIVRFFFFLQIHKFSENFEFQKKIGVTFSKSCRHTKLFIFMCSHVQCRGNTDSFSASILFPH